jgi:hypothetical protein
VWIATPQGARALAAGEAVGAGSVVQLQFAPGDARFVTLAGRDGSGAFEIYGIVTAEDTALQAAPFSLILDDVPGPQWFFAVGSLDRPQEPEVLRALSMGEDDARFSTYSVRLDKE